MKKSVIAAQNADTHGEKETRIYTRAMSKFDENLKCHFFDIECQYPITEEALKDLLEDTEEGKVIKNS